MAKKVHVKTGDQVMVISGNSKGTIGKVIAVSPKEGKVIIEGANVIKKHVKARRQGESSSIVETEGALYACKVALYCPECKKGVRTHNEVVDGAKVRVCAKCGHKFN